MGDSYRVLSKHDENLSCGQMVAPGETSDRVDPKDSHDRGLIDEGKLIPVSGEKQAPDYTATEAAEKLAAEEGIDLTTISGTGSDDNITQDDVKEAVAARDAEAAAADDKEEDD